MSDSNQSPNMEALVKQSLREIQRLKKALAEAEAKAEQSTQQPIQQPTQQSIQQPTHQSPATTDLAIVGIGCRLPGGIQNADDYWQLLANAQDAIIQVPPSRWPNAELFDPDPDQPGKISSRYGGFLEDIRGFDAPFFGISRKEAESLDPQQRLLLEVTWQALEDAAIAPDQLEGSATGVFVGICGTDYYHLMASRDKRAIDAYMASGSAHSTAAGRISFQLGLQGPCMAVDTACSSSLVALHLASQSLRCGESDLAIVGGVNTLLSPEYSINFSIAHMLSPDGRCKTFADGANGYVRAEGCVTVIVKRLADAMRDGNPVYAVIKGSAVNQDGHTSGLTVPNGPAQQAVIRQALSNAGLLPADIDYIEAHGTGTSLGDPIELGALGAVFNAARQTRPLKVGSVKTNLGHLEGAAGLAGVVKTALMLKHKTLVPNLHFDRPSSKIDWQRHAVQVQTALEPWQPTEDDSSPCYAGVSAFGFGGTNAHVILARASVTAQARESVSPVNPVKHLFLLSARTPAELQAQARRLACFNPEGSIAELCYSAALGRTHFEYRKYFPVESWPELQQALTAFTQTPPESLADRKPVQETIFMFTGQGAQWQGMAKALYAREPVFRQALDQCIELFDQQLKTDFHGSLASVLLHTTEQAEQAGVLDINETLITQPALFAFEYSLAQLWLSWGIKPAAMLGHSIGEIVAACLAGVFNLTDAVSLVALRARLMHALPREGGMVSVCDSQARIKSILKALGLEAQVNIAAVNGPQRVVISGVSEALRQATQYFSQQGIEHKALPVSHAFHSLLMEPMLAAFRQGLQAITFKPPRIRLISTVTGQLITEQMATEQRCDANYWVDQVRQPVRFYQAVETALALTAGASVRHPSQGPAQSCLLEIGPAPTLSGMAMEFTDPGQVKALYSMRYATASADALLNALGQLYQAGAAIDWATVFAGQPCRRCRLPGYPFTHYDYWYQENFTANQPAGLAGERLPFAAVPKAALYQATLTRACVKDYLQHRLFNQPLLPGAYYLEVMRQAATDAVKQGIALENIQFLHPLVLTALEHDSNGQAAIHLQTLVTPVDERWEIKTWAARQSAQNDWQLLATAEACIATDLSMASIGLPACAEVLVNAPSKQMTGNVLSPSLVDQCLLPIRELLAEISPDKTYVQTGADEYHVLTSMQKIPDGHLLCRILPADGNPIAPEQSRYRFDAEILQDQAQTVAVLKGIQIQQADHALLELLQSEAQLSSPSDKSLPSAEAAQDKPTLNDLFYHIEWRPLAEQPAPAAATGLTFSETYFAEIPQRIDSQESADYSDVLAPLEQLALAYVQHFFAGRISHQLTPNKPCTVSELMQQGRIAPQYERLLTAMLFALEQNGLAQSIQSRWLIKPMPLKTLAQLDEAAAALLKNFPAVANEITMLQRCSSALGRVLCEGVSPLELLFPADQPVTAATLYRDVSGAQIMNRAVVASIEAVLSAVPSDQPVRILEIGGGTGGTTRSVLAALADRAYHYCFTDISPLFTAQAQETFSAQAQKTYGINATSGQTIDCRVLNIDEPPSAQGFSAADYDLIIAANVLHATPDLDRTLRHVAQLLRPQGGLVLLESCAQRLWVDLIFGLTDGWWCFTDTHNRQHHALCSAGQWQALLAKHQFTDSVAIAPEARSVELLCSQRVLVSRYQNNSVDRSAACLVLCDQQGVGLQVAEKLRQQGKAVMTVALQGDSDITLTDWSKPQLRQLLTQWQGRELINCLAMTSAQSSEDFSQLDERLATGTLSTLNLIQVLNESRATDTIKAWHITAGSQAMAAHEVLPDVAGAASLGLIQVAGLELPNQNWRRCDLDYADLANSIERLTALMQSPKWTADQLIIRQGKVYAPRLTAGRPEAPHNEAQRSKVTIKADASYCVTGGLTGMGLRTAQWLAELGARQLLLLSRRGGDAMEASAKPIIEKLQAQGVKLNLCRCDVSDRTAVMALLRDFTNNAENLPLKGVFHSAGVFSDALVADHDWQRFETVFAPKIQGTVNLHQATAGLALDCFVLFSSAASMLGATGLANYVAANLFLDTFAAHRRALGLPALSINWGIWQSTGMATAVNETRQQQWRTLGIHTLKPGSALQAMQQLMQTTVAQAGIIKIDWPQFLKQFAHCGIPDYFAAFAPKEISSATQAVTTQAAITQTATRTQPQPLLEALKQARAAQQTPEQEYRLVQSHVQHIAAGVLGLKGDETIDCYKGFFDQGMDSLTSMELRNRLQQAIGQPLTSTLTFKYPTVAAVAGHIYELLKPSLQTVSVTQPVAAQVTQEERANRYEPIAIIGMGCRFPGGALTPEKFWQNLSEGLDGMVEIPGSRWSLDEYYSQDRDAVGKMYIRKAGLLDDVTGFDAAFFGISPREANSVDPQHRLLLEVAWEALENAGIVPERLKGSDTGVFVGIGQNDYGLLQLYSGDYQRINAYDGTGNGFCFASGRLSYALGLQGPCLSTDTACSSSLVSIDLACQHLRQGDCRIALAAGAQLMLSPDVSVFLSRAQALSPDSQCRSFDADANGYARGEGCGVVVLKPLSDAQRDGDNILAVIRASHVNHDGASSSLTVPNGLAQQHLMARALEKARIAAEAVSYLEAHGTGTKLGDPIEADAIAQVYCQTRAEDNPLWLGSVKTNVGHLETAAGIVGLIKVILSLQHRQIPASLHFKNPNPLIDWQGLKVPTRLMPWEAQQGRRLAAISSFGMSGTNAHVIVEEAPEQAAAPEQNALDPAERAEPAALSAQLLPLSAQSERSLRLLAEKYLHWLAENGDHFSRKNLAQPLLAELGAYVSTRRSHLTYRKGLVFNDMESLQRGLTALANDLPVSKVVTSSSNAGPSKIAFLFTGQGSQYVDMGRELYQTNRVFRDALNQCHALLLKHHGIALLDYLWQKNQKNQKNNNEEELGQEKSGRAHADLSLDQTQITQPALFALQYALAQTWQSWGIKPDLVLGHSVGEYAAAVVAGAMSFEAGLALIAWRGKLMQALEEPGCMMAVKAPVATLTSVLADYAATVSIAAINAPNETVIAGADVDLAAIAGQFDQTGIEYEMLNTSHAFHSPLMTPMLAAFQQQAETVRLQPPRITFISSVSGEVETDQLTQPDYWVRQIRQPVQFYSALSTLKSIAKGLAIEIGPKPVLLSLAKRSFPAFADNTIAVPSLSAAGQDLQTLMQAAARVYEMGYKLNWSEFWEQFGGRNTNSLRRLTPLPTYAWDHQTYWVQSSRRSAPRTVESEQPAQPAWRNWFYRVNWHEQALKTREPSVGEAAVWLMFCDDHQLVQSIETALQPDQAIHLVAANQKATGFNHRQLQAALNEVALQWGRLDAVIFAPAHFRRDSFHYAESNLLKALALSQALQDFNSQSGLAARLWFFSRGDTGSLWGLGRVVAQEQPELWGGLVDLPSMDDEALNLDQQARAIVHELIASSADNQIAYCQGKRYVLRLESVSELNNTQFTGREGAVLMTGSNGGIGQALTAWLGKRAEINTLYLFSRSEPSSEFSETLKALEQQGKQIIQVQGDVAKPEDIDRLKAIIEQGEKPLRAIFHTAGVLDDGLLENQTPEKFQRVWRAKVQGAWLLHDMLQTAHSTYINESLLDAFVLFSSAAALMGAAGQSNYAAANAELDRLALYRRAQGYTAVSINWGAWAEVGMASALSEIDQNRLAARGICPMPTEAAFTAMLAAAACGEANVAIMDVAWEKLFAANPGLQASPFFAELVPNAPVKTESPVLLELINTTPSLEHLDAVVDYLQQQVADILQLPADFVEPHKGFFDIGMDSLTAVELRKQLSQALGREVPSTLVFDFSTLERLAEFVLSQLQQQMTQTIPLDIASLSEAEMEAMIDQTLDAL